MNDVTTEPERHVHDWKPAPGWYARYRCATCGCFGYKGRMITTDEGTWSADGAHMDTYGGETVRPYLCSAREDGKPCGRPGVMKPTKRGPWRCTQHRPDQPKE
jgi:hypothetical protein